MQKITDRLLDFLFAIGPKLLGAALVVIVGLILTKLLLKLINRPLTKMNLSQTKRP